VWHPVSQIVVVIVPSFVAKCAVICRDLSNLSRFSSLEMLILDKNSITSLHAIKCPCIPTLSDLSCNNNNITDAMEFLLEVSEKFPNLHHLSIMRNPGVIDPFDEGIVGKLFSTKSTDAEAAPSSAANNSDIINNIPDQTADPGNRASELIPAEAPATTIAAEDTAVVDCVDFVDEDDDDDGPPSQFFRTPDASTDEYETFKNTDSTTSSPDKHAIAEGSTLAPSEDSTGSGSSTTAATTAESSSSSIFSIFTSSATQTPTPVTPDADLTGISMDDSDDVVDSGANNDLSYDAEVLSIDDLMLRFRGAVLNLLPSITALDGLTIGYEVCSKNDWS
jgi:hypothetical protein